MVSDVHEDNHRSHVVALLLRRGGGIAVERRSRRRSTPLPAPTTLEPPITDAEAAFPARLAVTTGDGKVLTFSPHEDPIVTPGVMSPSGQVVVERVTAARSHHGRVARRPN